MTQLNERECGICGLAIAKCNVLSQMVGNDGFWVNSTLEEMQELLRKLEAIQKEAIEAEKSK